MAGYPWVLGRYVSVNTWVRMYGRNTGVLWLIDSSAGDKSCIIDGWMDDEAVRFCLLLWSRWLRRAFKVYHLRLLIQRIDGWTCSIGFILWSRQTYLDIRTLEVFTCPRRERGKDRCALSAPAVNRSSFGFNLLHILHHIVGPLRQSVEDGTWLKKQR